MSRRSYLFTFTVPLNYPHLQGGSSVQYDAPDRNWTADLDNRFVRQLHRNVYYCGHLTTRCQVRSQTIRRQRLLHYCGLGIAYLFSFLTAYPDAWYSDTEIMTQSRGGDLT